MDSLAPLSEERKIVNIEAIPKQISDIQFGAFAAEDMRRISHVQIVNQELYQLPDKKPVAYGVLDARLGTATKADVCQTCGLNMANCQGHFGHLPLALPVFHIGFFKKIMEVLQRICKSCGRILLDEEACLKFLKKFRRKNIDGLDRAKMEKEILNLCKKVIICPHCRDFNGPMKKVGIMKIIHEKYKLKTKNSNYEIAVENFQDSFKEAIEFNKEIQSYIIKSSEDLSPLQVMRLFQSIPDNDVELLNMNPSVSRPETLILTHLLVPPIAVRPSVPSDLGSTEDDITINLTRIIHQNQFISQSIEKGASPDSIMENWSNLSFLCAFYINANPTGFPAMKQLIMKPSRSFVQRLKGKHGRFRGNLSGKRVDFSGRTVISPDPNLRIDQVAVPELVCKVLTFPERVNRHNIIRLRKMIENGPEVHPGANFVIKGEDNSSGESEQTYSSSGLNNILTPKENEKFVKRSLLYANRELVARDLRYGDIVERHICDGDVVLFNRQPSLHRLSIMAHRAKVLPYRTFRFNCCDCQPYNADFDGDEMNLHVPQTQEARAEALELMNVLKNMITPRNGEPLIGSMQDFLTAAFLMTRKNTFFDRAEFCLLCSYIGVDDLFIQIPPPTILKPMQLWTGKQIFSTLINPNPKKKDIVVNIDAKGKVYTKGEHMCPADGYVCFRNSYYVSGILDKKLLGGGSKKTLFYVLQKHYGAEYAAVCMARVAKVTTRWLMNYGFSIGINDVEPSKRLTEKKRVLLQTGYTMCDDYITKFNEGKLEAQPGCNAEQTLEAILNKELSKIRNDAGEICLDELPWQNAPLTMALCGSKGSNINISQMIAVVGQQSVAGARIANGFVNRTLPHFDVFEKTPAAKGFVANSFYTGLNPAEFFFHTMGGREGLVDTAVKTAETGYMQRKLMKALEDLSIQYDGTVRNSHGHLVQFNYGDDGLDPMVMEGDDGRPLNFEFSLLHVLNITKRKPGHVSLTMDQVREKLKQFLLGQLSFFSEKFQGEIREFVEKAIINRLNDLDSNAQSILKNWEVENVNTKNYEAELKEFERSLTNAKDSDFSVTEEQLQVFFKFLVDKYRKVMIEPGEAVGAVAGQSIGEPGTQMTLKTFHFAGVASMRVSLGVPRIVEIINATRNIATPIVTAELITKKSEQSARVVKGRIEKTTLGQIARHIREVYDMGICYIEIQLDFPVIAALQLDITNQSVMESILATPKIGFKDSKFIKEVGKTIRVYPADTSREKMYHNVQFLRRILPSVIVCGIPTISRAVINRTSNGEMHLLAEGVNLQAIMGTPGVNGPKTTSNNVLEIEGTLGIEAARKMIMGEIYYIMIQYGMTIDFRHLMLLADLMTFKGVILGINRFGISKMKDSVLMLASFEKTTDHLFDAAVHSAKDKIAGVSECIIMGIPIGLGTGAFKLFHDANKKKTKERTPLFT